jgi:hypothetical protein
VDPGIGIPFSRGEFVTNPEELPGNPNPAQYQAYDPDAKKVLDGVFLAGWSRNASVGLVGVAKQDAERGMKVVNQYLSEKAGMSPGEMAQKIEALAKRLNGGGVSFVRKEDVDLLEAVEKEEASKRNIHEYKFAGDDEMLAIVEAKR